jgi:hypothetical protein
VQTSCPAAHTAPSVVTPLASLNAPASVMEEGPQQVTTFPVGPKPQ